MDVVQNNWSKAWISALLPHLKKPGEESQDKLSLYPLQFANCDRLEVNDSVFIFDEVGSGKTISAGLMTLHYLYNKPGTVLVITTNSVKEQFKEDWYLKLPFAEADEQWNSKSRIEFVNNIDCNIEKKLKNYGLIIVDEVHKFLTAEKRQESLRKLKSDKVVFLTATPVKEWEWDLKKYVYLAAEIIGYDNPTIHKLEKLLINRRIQGEEDIRDVFKVDSFDAKHPITRYFKDTIKNLEYKENQEIYQKTKAIRQETLLWEYEYQENPFDVLHRNVENILTNSDSHFIVFTRLKKKGKKDSARDLGYFFEEKGYRNFDTAEQGETRTYKVLDGDTYANNKEGFSAFLKCKYRPTVLIMVHSMGEEGLNLAGFDYVVNLYISQYPSNLEQRFGRIDRLGTAGQNAYEHIHMVFMLQKSGGYHCNTSNYYAALARYIQLLLPYFPSRNVLLNKENINDLLFWLETKEQGKERLDAKKEELKERLRNLLNEMPVLWDTVFYVDTHQGWNVKTLGHPIDFGERIFENPNYKEYRKEFEARIKFTLLEKRFSREMSEFFEQCFINNDFNSLFPKDGYGKVFERMLSTERFNGLNESERDYLQKESSAIVKRLPFFIMCERYKRLIMNYSQNGEGRKYKRFYYIPFIRAMAVLGNLIKNNGYCGLSKEFVETYWTQQYVWKSGKDDSEDGKYLRFFLLNYDDSIKRIEASNWYKLAYHLSTTDFRYFFYNDSENMRGIIKNRNNYSDRNGVEYDALLYIQTEEQSYFVPYFDKQVKLIDSWTKGILCNLKQ